MINDSILHLIQILATPLLAWIGFEIRSIRQQVNCFTTRLAKVEEWIEGHENLNKEQIASLRREITHKQDG